MAGAPDARAAETAAALLSTVEWLAAHTPGGWVERDAHGLVGVAGPAVPNLNGVMLPSGAGGLGVEAIVARVERTAGGGVPYGMQFPLGDEVARAAAVASGLTRDDDIPLMRLDVAPSAPEPAGLAIRRLAPAEVPLHGDIAAAGFGVPRPILDGFTSSELAASAEAHYYVGEVDGESVSTGLGTLVDGAIGVWDIGTPPEHRRHGYGAAITGRIVHDGLAAGAAFAWLQSSTAGAGVYAALGFVTVATWEFWVAE